MRMQSRIDPRQGQIIILLAIAMVSLVGMLALSLDGGAIRSEQRHAQSTADGAAAAAGGQLYLNHYLDGGTDADHSARGIALKVAAQNGYLNDLERSRLTVHIPPSSGEYAGRNGYVEVIAEYNYPRGFSAIFGSGDIPVRARAVAVGLPMSVESGIIVLDPSVKDALGAGGNAEIRVLDAPIIVNSSHAQGTIANGGGIIIAPEMYLTGGYTTVGGGSIQSTIHVNRNPVEDPLRHLPVPDKSKMTVRSKKKIQQTSGNITLEPGVYTGGINVSSKANLTLEPGIYYMDGGGFSFSGQGSLYGEGVMIYNDPGKGNADGISVTGQGQVQLSGMTTGVYRGLAFFQDRNSSVTGKIAGNGDTQITGTFYFAGAQLQVTGNGGLINLGSQFIAKTLKVDGNGTILIQWKPEKVAQTRMVTIVE